MVCGKPLRYFKEPQTASCSICKGRFEAEALCEDGHFVCDSCHMEKGIAAIKEIARRTACKDPLKIAREMMKADFVNMHGPEHHFLLVAALLAAYNNAGGTTDLNAALEKAEQRSKDVPGGACGMWGCCGAAIGAGIFMSIVTEADPLSKEEWQNANSLTALCLQEIAKNGGPRCCKRNVFLATRVAAAFAEKKLGVKMELPQKWSCGFFGLNEECRKTECPFYPKDE